MAKRKKRPTKAWLLGGLTVLLSLAAAEGFYRSAKYADATILTRQDGVFDLYALGGSIATGYPYMSPVAFPNIVSRMYGGQLLSRKLAPQIVTSSGGTLIGDYFHLRQALRYRKKGAPGAALIYSGLNKPAEVKRRWVFSLFQKIRESPLGQSLLLVDLLFEAQSALGVGPDPLEGYAQALRGIALECRKNGVKPVFATVVLQVAGREPGAGQPESRRRYDVCRAMERARRFAAAKACYAGASEALTVASAHGELMRQVGRELGVPVIETQELFERRAPHGIVGASLFEDEGHPNHEGQILLAEAFAAQLQKLYGEKPLRFFKNADDLLKDVAYPNDKRVCGLVGAGFLALKDAQGLEAPERRAFAADHFKRALALSPKHGTALLGLGLSQAAKIPRFDFFRLLDEPSTEDLQGTACIRACLSGEIDPAVPKELSQRILKSDLPRGCR